MSNDTANPSTTPGDTVLSVENVSKSYGSIRALNDLSLTVDSGRFVALLGPNGAGKSTLFQLLSGLFVTDAGRILIQGHDIRRSAVAVLANLGIVFQQPTLDADLTVRANLRFHARLHGMNRSRQDQRIEAELQRLALSEYADKPCRSLSGGNRRKVELARALLHEPQLLLMDEATVGLDPASRRSLLENVHELCAVRGMAALWATHLVDEAERADSILVLHRGELICRGTPGELLEETGEASLADAFLKLTFSS